MLAPKAAAGGGLLSSPLARWLARSPQVNRNHVAGARSTGPPRTSIVTEMLKARRPGYVTHAGAGDVYSPMVRQWQQKGYITRTMPETIYTAVIISSMTADGWMDTVVIVLPFIAVLLATLLVQLTLLVYVYDAILHPDTGTSGSLASECIPADEGNALLRNVALLTFVSSVFKSMRETCEMYFWLSIFRKTKLRARHVPLRVVASRGRRGSVANLAASSLETTTTKPASGLTGRERLSFRLLLVSKVLVEVATLFVGSGAVLRSASKLDVVLNAVAATFILDVDDCFFVIFTGKMWEPFTQAPELSASVKPWMVYGQLLWPLTTAGFVALLHVSMIGIWCWWGLAPLGEHGPGADE